MLAHGRGYWLYECDDPTAGIAAAKTTRLMRRGKPYELPLLEHIYHRRFQGCAVDVGANIGNHTMWLAVICGLEVYAFEPLMHEELLRNVDLNALAGRVTVLPVALGDATGYATHMLNGQLAFIDRLNDIPVKRLDDYELERVSVVKIDVEGMEPAVLAGAEQTIRRWCPTVYAEEWTATEHQRVAEILEPWGYTLTHLFTAREADTPVGEWEHTA
jgi:FkbM family methyltransferase